MRERRRRNQYLNVFRPDDLARAREANQQAQEDIRDMMNQFGISNENFADPDRIETIDECVAREEEEFRQAEEEESRRAEEARQREEERKATLTLRQKIQEEALMRREQFRRSLLRARMQQEARQRRDQINRTLQNVRDQVPNIHSRLRAAVHREE